ncbi:unnamed protein product [Darwinula stevensoni]|uniref:Peroxisomal membrane protein PEX14 n=1 Tax=Darwinula stevensoni TaxID=69355 RepID=A0A7R9AE61_9CRUS|nr:unnamed protein product [Darwinula stevensoni]CAG0902023.1 unnamed protein product [Darwinula stevensoni]
MASSDLTNALSNARSGEGQEALLQAAIKFLENAQIQGRPITEKLEFLRKKGLSEENIQEALSQLIKPYWPFSRNRRRGMSHSSSPEDTERFLHSLSQSLLEMRVSVEEIKERLTVTAEVQKHQHLLEDLKKEVASLKGLLLSRHQFPSMPNPGIPEWQKVKKGGGNINSIKENGHADGIKENGMFSPLEENGTHEQSCLALGHVFSPARWDRVETPINAALEHAGGNQQG